MKKISFVVYAFVFFSCTKMNEWQNPINPPGLELSVSGGSQAVMPNELLIQFTEDATEMGKANAFKALGASVKENIFTHAMKRSGKKEGIFLITTNLNALDAKAKLAGNSSIAFVEPNYIYQSSLVSNDLSIYNLWGMNGSFGINAPLLWETTTGSAKVVIGIIDEGVMISHEDLSANIGKTAETSNGIDDDGNGYIDDINGWDFANNDKTIFDGTGDDHGTHVAGTIGGVGNNGKGVVGVNWTVSILNAKFLGSRGGTTANAIKAVDYFTDLKVNRNINIVATNNSWGGGGYSQGLFDAIERANKAGILFIAAAGNSSVNIDASPQYPAAYSNDNIISVAAIDATGNLASYSNYGATLVDIAAPGSSINSTLPLAVRKSIASGYGAYSGTSMATPHVTGAVALYASKYPTATAAQIKAAILSNATALPSVSGKVLTGGRLDLKNF